MTMMIFHGDQLPVAQVAELLEKASARTGFSAAEIQELVDCELDVSDLLDYVTAVISDRMN
jgi:hypothetical protein